MESNDAQKILVLLWKIPELNSEENFDTCREFHSTVLRMMNEQEKRLVCKGGLSTIKGWNNFPSRVILRQNTHTCVKHNAWTCLWLPLKHLQNYNETRTNVNMICKYLFCVWVPWYHNALMEIEVSNTHDTRIRWELYCWVFMIVSLWISLNRILLLLLKDWSSSKRLLKSYNKMSFLNLIKKNVIFIFMIEVRVKLY